METKIAKTFLTVAKLNNITKGAEQLGYSQSAVTAQIKQLEDDLGVQLFDRIGRSIQLTDARRNFIPYAIRLLQASEDADAFAEVDAEPSGSLVIDSSSTAAQGILAKLLLRFHEQYPKIHVAVRISEDIDVLINRVRQNRSDIAIFLNPREEYPGCTKAAERKEDFRFVASPSDPITRKKHVPLKDVFDGLFVDSFITTDKNSVFNYLLRPSLLSRNVEASPMLEFGTSASIVALLLSGYGRSFLPYMMLEDEIRHGRLALIDTEVIDLDIWSQVFYSDSRWISPHMQAFIDFIAEELH